MTNSYKILYMTLFSLVMCIIAQAFAMRSNAREVPFVNAEAFFQITPEEMESGVRPSFSAMLMSQRFVFEYLEGSPVNVPYIFQETIDQEESTLREQTDGRVTVTAYEAHPDGTPQFWQFNANGRGGDFLYGEVYRLKQSFCCDMSSRKVYYDLHSGTPLFSTTAPALVVTDHDVYRYIGYDDGFGSEQPAEMQADKAISGILYYSGRQIPTQRLAVLANTGEDYRQQDFSISVNGHTMASHDNVLYLRSFPQSADFSFDDELLLKVKLHCRCDTDEFIEIPIAHDAFLIGKAVVSSGIALKLL